MSDKITLNPRIVKIYKLLREFGLSEIQASVLAKKTFDKMPKECQVPKKSEIEEAVEKKQ